MRKLGHLLAAGAKYSLDYHLDDALQRALSMGLEKTSKSSQQNFSREAVRAIPFQRKNSIRIMEFCMPAELSFSSDGVNNQVYYNQGTYSCISKPMLSRQS
mmetsp:Transcript_21853/g.54141  ORF Transcript_21853/g.54141 Transcript_21853/m.54141 type:complete len:101 (-) Transcript_21853:373-675(-)